MKESIVKRMNAKMRKISGWSSIHFFESLNKKYGGTFYLQFKAKENITIHGMMIFEFILFKNEYTYPIIDEELEKILGTLMYKASSICKKELKGERCISFDVSSDYYSAKECWKQGDEVKALSPLDNLSTFEIWEKYDEYKKGKNSYIRNSVFFTLRIYYPNHEAINLLSSINSK